MATLSYLIPVGSMVTPFERVGPPAYNPATLSREVGSQHDYTKASFINTRDESVFAQAPVPEGYVGGGVSIRIRYKSPINVGDVQFDVEYEDNVTGEDWDEAFGHGPDSNSGTLPATIGDTGLITVNLATPGALSAGAPARFHIKRNNSVGSNAAGAVEVVSVEIIYTVPNPSVTTPAGMKTVSAGGGADYTTISAALAAAIANDIIFVYSGDYAEDADFTGVAANVRLLGIAGFAVRITGSSTTSTRLTIPQGGHTIRDITVLGPSSGANPAILHSAPTGNTIFFTLNCISAGSTGAFIEKTGAGTLTCALVGHNGGTLGGAVFDIQAGLCRFVQGGANLNAGTVGEFIKATGTGKVFGALLQVGAAATVTDIFQVDDTATLNLANVLVDANATVTRGLNILADGVTVILDDVELIATNDIVFDSGLTGAGTVFRLNNCTFRFETLDAPPAIFTGLPSPAVSWLDPGVYEEPRFRIGGAELSVGVPNRRSESTFGSGDSTSFGMVVWTDDGTGTSWVDVTTDTKDGTGFTTQGTAAGNGTILVGTLLGVKFSDLRINLDTLAVLSTGEYVIELWTGVSYEAIEFMVSDRAAVIRDAPTPLQNAVQSRIHINTLSSVYANWVAHDPGNGQGALYWRIRNTGTIATEVIVDNIRTGFSRTEINESGGNAWYGDACEEHYRSLPGVNLGNAMGLVGGAAPSNSNITVSSSVTFDANDNGLGTNDGLGWPNINLDNGIHTGLPLRLWVVWQPAAASTGQNVQFTARKSVYGQGDTVAGALAEQDTLVTSGNTSGVNGVIRTPIEIDISDLEPEQSMSLALIKTGGTYGGTVRILGLEAECGRWRP